MKLSFKTGTGAKPVTKPESQQPTDLPDKQIQPRMHELKKPVKSETNMQKPSRNLLWGTGLTKKILQQQVKAHDKEQAQPQESAISIKQQDSIAFLDDHILPDQLVDDSLQLDEDQQDAVNGLMRQMYGCIIGAAGCGKTTSLKALVAAIESTIATMQKNDLTTLRDQDRETGPNKTTIPAIAFCAPTGKAAQQMKRALPKKYHQLVSTIHALLGYAPIYEEREYIDDDGEVQTKKVKIFVPTYDASNKLPHKLIIMDESGSCPVQLWHKLLDAKTADCRVLFLGDINQIPPVSGHSILGFAMQQWPTFELRHIHRQAADNPILANAHRILNGKLPQNDEKEKKFVLKYIEAGMSEVRKQTLGILQHLVAQDMFDPMQDVLIVPQNITPVGQLELNQVLVNLFNPPLHDETGKRINPRTVITAGYEKRVFAVGDKIMLLHNDTERGLTNGMVGVVTKIVNNHGYKGENTAHAMMESMEAMKDLDLENFESFDLDDDLAIEDEEQDALKRQASHIMTVKFQNVDDEMEFTTAGEFRDVAHGYAITCHKAQGSEYRHVVVLAHSVNHKMLCREWLYTAVTRAKERVILLTNRRGLLMSINNQRIKGITLQEKVQKFIALTKAAKDEPPAILPKPQTITEIKTNVGVQ